MGFNVSSDKCCPLWELVSLFSYVIFEVWLATTNCPKSYRFHFRQKLYFSGYKHNNCSNNEHECIGIARGNIKDLYAFE